MLRSRHPPSEGFFIPSSLEVSPMNVPIPQFLRRRLFLLKRARWEVGLISLMLFGLSIAAAPLGIAQATDLSRNRHTDPGLNLEIEAILNADQPFGALPKNDWAHPDYALSNIPVTAYNSVTWQTDDTPCIGAQGTNICHIYERGEDVCAANFVPLGTVLTVEGLGDCVVRDRMNARYDYRVDWYMGYDIDAARNWGVRYQDIEVHTM